MGPETGEEAEAPPGAGVLLLVTGPSGAGKDTLIAAARGHFHGDDRFVFPRRVVTRSSDVSEQVREVSFAAFEAIERRGGFFLAWRAHGLAYGIPADVSQRLAQGRVVVVNVSRRIVGAARELWARNHVVHIHVAPEVLEARLQNRGRETAGQIGERLSRYAAFAAAGPPEAEAGATIIDNSGDFARARARFIAVLEDQAVRAQRSTSRKGAA